MMDSCVVPSMLVTIILFAMLAPATSSSKSDACKVFGWVDTGSAVTGDFSSYCIDRPQCNALPDTPLSAANAFSEYINTSSTWYANTSATNKAFVADFARACESASSDTPACPKGRPGMPNDVGTAPYGSIFGPYCQLSPQKACYLSAYAMEKWPGAENGDKTKSIVFVPTCGRQRCWGPSFKWCDNNATGNAISLAILAAFFIGSWVVIYWQRSKGGLSLDVLEKAGGVKILSACSTGNDSTLFKYRLFCAVFASIVMVMELIMKHQEFALMRFFTNWNYVGLIAYFWVAAMKWSRESPESKESRKTSKFDIFMWVFLEALATFAIFLTLFYWVMVFPKKPLETFAFLQNFYGFTVICFHGLNAVMLFGEIYLNSLPLDTKWTAVHLQFVWVYAVFMLSWSAIQRSIGDLPKFIDGVNGVNKNLYEWVWPYDALDTNSALGAVFYVALPIGIIGINFAIAKAFGKCRPASVVSPA